MNGYKAMLRDRIPQTWSLALKYCKAKGKWIEYVYTRHIKPLDESCRRNKVLELCGARPFISRGNLCAMARTFGKLHPNKPDPHVDMSKFKLKFDDTIMFKELDAEWKLYWIRVSDWVNWFTTTYAYIENAYKTWTRTDEEFERYLGAKYTVGKDLAKYLLKCLKY